MAHHHRRGQFHVTPQGRADGGMAARWHTLRSAQGGFEPHSGEQGPLEVIDAGRAGRDPRMYASSGRNVGFALVRRPRSRGMDIVWPL